MRLSNSINEIIKMSKTYIQNSPKCNKRLQLHAFNYVRQRRKINDDEIELEMSGGRICLISRVTLL